MAPKTPSYKEYITAIEVACQSLKPTDVEEWKALKQLKADKDGIILTANKGVVLVVMDKSD